MAASYESWASSPAARKAMQGNRSRDTKPELAVRRLIHAAGLRYRVDVRPEHEIARRADIVFTKQRIAVFIDGCYWHGCEQHARIPTSANADYWSSKITRNAERDEDTNRQLEAAGWTVLRFWEHEEPGLVRDRVIAAMRARST